MPMINQPLPMAAPIFLYSLSDLTTSSTEKDLTLHTTFSKNAKGLEHLSANIPRWLIDPYDTGVITSGTLT